MMKLKIITLLVAATLMGGCNSHSGKSQQPDGNPACCNENKTARLTREAIKARPFDELFDSIDVKGIQEDIFTLVGDNYGILTAGTAEKYNSMVTSWGGWGIVFGKPGVFHFLRSNRYTLELMRQQKSYTVAFFDEEYKDEILLFGMKSGRDSNKMKETKLTAVKTPNGNLAYKEAKIILECQIAEITSVTASDFYNNEDREFVTKAYQETGDWHKVVLSQITKAWVRK